MIDRRDPIAYLAALNDAPPGSLLQGINEWIGQIEQALCCPEISNGQEESLQRMLAALELVKIDVVAGNGATNAYIIDQKIKAQTAIDFLAEEE